MSETLEEGDFETRYDLGLAYREMGLFEDAIGEFRVCLDFPTRRFDSLYLMGLCARDLSRFDDAVNRLEQALALPEIPVERLAGVYFDLSVAQEGAGDTPRAYASIEKVVELDADFPEAAARLAALKDASTSPRLGEPGEGLESFDDLFSDDDEDAEGDAAMAEAVPVEAFESFDDVVEEAKAILEVEELVEPEKVVEAKVESVDANADSKTGNKSGRNKISFV